MYDGQRKEGAMIKGINVKLFIILGLNYKSLSVI
jgi:hypothetical protein